MTPADRKTLTLMLNLALEHEGSLMGTLDGREGALLDRRCQQNIVRFKTCADRILTDAARLSTARKLLQAYLKTAGLRPKVDIIKLDEWTRAWLKYDKPEGEGRK